MSRSVTATLGVLLGVVGLAALAVPGITTPLPTGESFVLIVGLVLLLGALAQVQRRRHTELEYAETPDAELAVDLPTPGDDLDRRLGRLQLTRFNEGERHRIRDEISRVATETIRRRERGSAEAAERALDEGTWTDDPFAAAFLTGRVPQAPTTDRLRELFNRESPFKRRAVRAIDAVERLLETDEPGGAEGRRAADDRSEADDE
ncbi:hypothetical protein C475_00080 [Halosimplex carlsbadense 2-9-1]|uniref:Uncharacterized protein n=1 Tax=Halosimplex carlsbadense 2-9-1 TaxID=797114 RepID=M0D8N1_9EURY|nr:hypothetical protein [Halosimplex carlsbadense]ELZ30494.1 hypothetical protein C475_00080 [Halosimplex carlsbadense 2-9-1]